MSQTNGSAGSRLTKDGGPRATASPHQPAPPFVSEITGTLAVHSQFVLHGNIRDRYLAQRRLGGKLVETDRSLPESLWDGLRHLGYGSLLSYDQITGFVTLVGPDQETVVELLDDALRGPRTGRRGDRTPQLLEAEPLLREIVSGFRERRTAQRRDGREAEPLRLALLIDYSSRLSTDVTRLSDAERDFFLACVQLAREAEPFSVTPRRALRDPSGEGELFNPVIWLADSDRDLPHWLLSGSERIRTVAVPGPDADERRRMAGLLASEHPPVPAGAEAGHQDGTGVEQAGPDRRALLDPVSAFAKAATGLSLDAMRQSHRLALSRGLPFEKMPDAVRVYRLGVEKDPWRSLDIRERIAQGYEHLTSRVRGQEPAVTMTLDILKRAALGLSGAQATTAGHRPRGVLFFAGPTGTGKTEMAKSVAQLLFDSEEAYLRFDMSEFSSAHAADRLVGAPPGYVGYEAGGELTRAVRADPFRVILFDEIEKAHQGVMDKFLQLLEDGRLTDGQGVTTYFSECVLIFTSNLGVQHTDPHTKQRVWDVQPEDDYRDLAKRVKGNIRHHFEAEVGRPELMNRFGGNVVVFGFVTGSAAEEVLDLSIGNIAAALWESQGIRLEIVPQARRQLGEYCMRDPYAGGRGIGMALETHLINPLARAIFTIRPRSLRGALRVTRVTEDQENGSVDLGVEHDTDHR
ncbi:AAA family ATPase [Streptomyces xinghaiensis]|uniref:AAA family ATPase n=1 Tax=Streptomyces xinghaiensis TaxID=1038928 RepID=UPI0002FD4055|nr:AAA family ATPase [Streptomyces xinghaiensis]MZE76870.1 AAA domain-containing protein [Streptomyces sp. SID5475]